MRLIHSVALAVSLACSPALARAGEVWFDPLQEAYTPNIEFTKYDFPAMLPHDAPWQDAASRISVLELSEHTLEHYPDIPGLLAFFAAHPWIRVGTAGSFAYTDAACGTSMEGVENNPAHDYAHEIVGAVRHWKSVGGRLDQLDVDGGYSPGRWNEKCGWSAAEVARRVANTVLQIRQIYPDVQVSNADGNGSIPLETWLPDYLLFVDAFKAATGTAFTGISLDLHWNPGGDFHIPGYTWQGVVRATIGPMHARGIKVGLVVDAYNAPTAAAWTAAAREHIEAMSTLGLDYAVVASWFNQPPYNIPSSNPERLSSLILDACQAMKCQAR